MPHQVAIRVSIPDMEGIAVKDEFLLTSNVITNRIWHPHSKQDNSFQIKVV